MTVLSVIEQAIRSRTPIRFQYIREGKDPGARMGHPHAVFLRRLKAGGEHVYLHLWQTGGVTDSGEALPSWRQFLLNDISDPVLDQGDRPFPIATGYNPVSYEHPIAMVR